MGLEEREEKKREAKKWISAVKINAQKCKKYGGVVTKCTRKQLR